MKMLPVLLLFSILLAAPAFAASYQYNVTINVTGTFQPVFSQFINFTTLGIEPVGNYSLRVFDSSCTTEIPSELVPPYGIKDGKIETALLVLKPSSALSGSQTFCFKYNDTVATPPVYTTDLVVKTGDISNSLIREKFLNGAVNWTKPPSSTRDWNHQDGVGGYGDAILVVNGFGKVTPNAGGGSCVLQYNGTLAAIYNCTSADTLSSVVHTYFAYSLYKRVYVSNPPTESGLLWYCVPNQTTTNSWIYYFNTSKDYSGGYQEAFVNITKGIVFCSASTSEWAGGYLWKTAINETYWATNADTNQIAAGARTGVGQDNLSQVPIVRIWVSGADNETKKGNMSAHFNTFIASPPTFSLAAPVITPPSIYVYSPANNSVWNNTGFGANVALNMSVVQGTNAIDKCWYTRDVHTAGAEYFISCSETTISGVPAGTHTFIFYVNDTAGNAVNTTPTQGIITVLVNDIPPTVSIQSPTNTTYPSGINISVNYTASATVNPIDECTLTLNNNAPTILPNCINTTFVGISDGSNNITITVNDTSGYSSSATVFFTLFTVVNPSITIEQPTATTYTAISSIEFRYTPVQGSYPIDSCWYNTGGSDIATDCGWTNISVAFQSYTLNAFVNDTQGNIGSASVSFTVSAEPALSGTTAILVSVVFILFGLGILALVFNTIFSGGQKADKETLIGAGLLAIVAIACLITVFFYISQLI